MKISFTGMTIDSADLEGKCYSGWRNPLEWLRIVVNNADYFDSEKMAALAEEHFTGRFGIHSGYSIDFVPYTVIMFEQDNDAVMFKLLGGVEECSIIH